MFTGLVETMGTVRNFRPAGTFYVLSIEAEKISEELKVGQSVSVSGACLTVTKSEKKFFEVEIMRETFNRTWFGKSLRPGMSVNLERAVRLTDRLDGHLVLGHIDGIAVLKELHGNETKEAVFTPDNKDLLLGIVEKGSVALDGVSLTVISVSEKSFSVGLIPTTLKFCTLGRLKVGMSVNLETDILGKYVARLCGPFGLNSKPGGDYLTSLLQS